MAGSQNGKVPRWFWVAAAVLLLWNLLGVAAFVQYITITDEALQALPDAERNVYASYPVWTKIAYALAVFGGAIGCIGLLLRKKWAISILIISLIAVIIQMFHSLFIAKATDVYGPGAAVMPVLVVLIAFSLVWLARFAAKRHWLR